MNACICSSYVYVELHKNITLPLSGIDPDPGAGVGVGCTAGDVVLVNVVPDVGVITITDEMAAVTMVGVTSGDISDEAVAIVKPIVVVTSIIVASVVESSGPVSMTDVDAIIEPPDSVFVSATGVKVVVASITTEVDTYMVTTLSVVGTLIDVKLSITVIVAGMLIEALYIPTTTKKSYSNTLN